MFDIPTQYWLFFTTALSLAVAVIASAHAILTKRDTRAAIAWVGLVWLTPLIGSLLYLWLGINRIERRARRLRGSPQSRDLTSDPDGCDSQVMDETFGERGAHLRSLATLLGKITQLSLTSGNEVTPLINGEQAFPAMLEAINTATASISLETYIFDNDEVGNLFLEALKQASERGVEVRVLVDGMGARYSWPAMPQALRRAGINCGIFLPPTVPWRFAYSNLRTHRKTLVVDGRVAFTGGMNIRAAHCVTRLADFPTRDVHVRVEGPVVAQIQEVFVDDWLFCTAELLEGDKWFPVLTGDGNVLARGIADGPDDNFESFRNALLGAIACAESSIRVMSPYFLPDDALITALNVAALRGITVDIVLPSETNVPIVQWASQSLLWQIVERGCRVWLSPPPFDHTKLMVVDDLIVFVGSSNWDPRSLRLNFEFNLECYSRSLAKNLKQIVDERIAESHLLSLQELNSRNLLIKLRDGIARLGSPYL